MVSYTIVIGAAIVWLSIVGTSAHADCDPYYTPNPLACLRDQMEEARRAQEAVDAAAATRAWTDRFYPDSPDRALQKIIEESARQQLRDALAR